MVSKTGFILALIGGILQILSGLAVFVGGNFLSNIITGVIRNVYTITAGAVYIAVGIVSLVAAEWMNSKDKVRKGAILATVMGIIGINILTLIGGIVGIVESKYNKAIKSKPISK